MTDQLPTVLTTACCERFVFERAYALYITYTVSLHIGICLLVSDLSVSVRVHHDFNPLSLSACVYVCISRCLCERTDRHGERVCCRWYKNEIRFTGLFTKVLLQTFQLTISAIFMSSLNRTDQHPYEYLTTLHILFLPTPFAL